MPADQREGGFVEVRGRVGAPGGEGPPVAGDLVQQVVRGVGGVHARLDELEAHRRDGTKAAGSQTLARGLLALELVAGQPRGLAVQDVAQHLGVHRTIAYRILVTLAEHHLVVRASDGRYRAGSGTVTLVSAEGNEAVAVAVAEPLSVNYLLSYRVGSRNPVGVGAAGLALAALRPAEPDESPEVTQAREQGYARTFGRIEPGAYGVAVPLHLVDPALHMCVNLITWREDVADASLPAMRAVAEEISALG
ncbi:helix-turn-helix domain-containing protein [Streptomyces albidoflavus]|uniref:helix-turn-helix domain-containing protein n=1 Tax=Streptomyces albidoflavus TaxID=1886 RepID=UPI0033D33FD5